MKHAKQGVIAAYEPCSLPIVLDKTKDGSTTFYDYKKVNGKDAHPHPTEEVGHDFEYVDA